MDRQLLISLLQSEPEIQAAVLFGSQATQQADKNSDIDIALLYKSDPDPMNLLQFQQFLSDEMQQEVDLVALNTASPIIAMQALKKGVLLYAHDLKAYQAFEVKLITDYADLKRLLEPFEKNILDRKLHD